ncbi:hypothetical protein G1H11_13480 [Phytoactinopolyspora alkaliphila]|uniref:Uncharacterized protein n=1 Tax=Phytoactinopolyspora alkaliphila TaxID=1783498 RepID=A0A6N9YN29_9ACTN|nr:hypothetical protein [Phytoactinopolyspora alkaliphila]NED96320.1 hypothetical protein [Phytoactinopolyspora alkaliphila]
MCDEEERMVPNPYLAAMDSLIRRTENAVEDTPNMDAPTDSIGEGPAWTGRKAREIHDDYLSPNADPVRTALNDLVSDVETRKGEFDAEVPEGVANAIRADLNYR